MGDLLAGLPIGQIGAGALLGIAVLMILSGKLVPRQQLLDVQSNCDHWRASSETWQQVATQHGMTLERLIEYASAADHALNEIQAGLVRASEET